MTSFLAPLSLALAAATLAAGCATDSSSANAPASEPMPTREYRTGSNIPVREPKTASEQDKARAESPKGSEPAKTN